MSVHLVGTDWAEEFRKALRTAPAGARLIAPFVKDSAVELLLNAGLAHPIQVITRFSLDDLYAGVSDIRALRRLLNAGAQVRGIQNLHAKVYVFGGRTAIVTSANLTHSALHGNHEFGITAEDPMVVRACERYFAGLWERSGPDLDHARLDEWQQRIDAHVLRAGRPGPRGLLGDEGADVHIPPAPLPLPLRIAEARRSFVKFFGEGHHRSARSVSIEDEVMHSGSHRYCSYPRRPRQVDDGDVIFMGRMVSVPDDVAVYGRAVAQRHQPGRDDVSADDLLLRPWRRRWPYMVRVHHPEFIDGELSHGVLLSELMKDQDWRGFASTRRNTERGTGNTKPRSSLRQQPAVELSPEGFAWLNTKLEEAFSRHGKLSPAVLEGLDERMRLHNEAAGA